MPVRKRKRREPIHDWQEIQQAMLRPEQETYERLRSIILFGETAAQRARETGASERTLHYQATLFEQEGMTSLFPKPHPPSPEPGRSLPPEMCQMIVNLKAEYPDFSLRQRSLIFFGGCQLFLASMMIAQSRITRIHEHVRNEHSRNEHVRGMLSA